MGALAKATAFVLLGMVAACGSGPTETGGTARRPDLGPEPSVTVYPVVVAGRPDPQVALVVGVMLERGGLTDVEVAEAGFVPAAGDVEAEAAAFGAAVAQRGLQTDYALLAVYDGTPGVGVDEVRGALVAADGTVVWADRQRPGDTAFDRVGPECPMTCSVLLVERLREPLHLGDPLSPSATGGKLSVRLQEQSLAPPAAEREAMAERIAALRRAERPTVLVYPVRVGDAWCAASAVKLAALVAEGGALDPRVVGEPLEFEVTATRNQQTVLWSAARSIQERLRAAEPDADYALLADFMISPQTGEAVAVHTFLLERDGDWVIVDYQNSHHEDFQRIAPASRDACCELSAVRLRAHLR